MPASLRILLPLAATCGAVGVEAVTLWQDSPWDFDWDERLTAQEDPGLMPGFGRHPRLVAAGGWGGSEFSAIAAGRAQAERVPGTPPVVDGGEVDWQATYSVAMPHWFVTLRPELLVTADRREAVPSGDPRALWDGSDPAHGYSRFTAVPRLTLGAAGLGHVLAATNEPFSWGEGVFGGLLFGRAWRGFPHLALMPIEPWNPGGSEWFIAYEAIGGVLEDRTAGIDDRFIAGWRVSARWRWLTVAAAAAELTGGRSAVGSDPGTDWAPLWPGSADTPGSSERLTDLSLSLSPFDALAIGAEYLVDHVGDDGLGALHPHAAAMLATIDWLDITGTGRWRTALEGYRSENQVYGDPTFPWDYRDQPLGHLDGGDALSVRWLLQTADGEDLSVASIIGWRRDGWRNADSGNLNPSLPAADQVAGGPFLAPRPWDRWSWDVHVERAVLARGRGSLLVDFGLAYERNREFVAGDDGWSALAGLGWRSRW